MRVCFRVDSSVQIGIGHVMRCLALAQALSQRGAQCSFACRSHLGHSTNIIRDHGFEVHEFALDLTTAASDNATEPPMYQGWLGTTWQEDAYQLANLASPALWDLLIVDHYALDHHWESAVRPLCRRLMVIDDLANRLHHCDLLLDQNPGRQASDYHDLVPSSALLCIGPGFCLLRSEFSSFLAPALRRRHESSFANLLMTYGGIDRDGYTLKALQTVQQNPKLFSCINNIKIVLGEHCPWKQQVQDLAQQIPLSVQILINCNFMAQLMSESDIAFGAGGVAALERAYMYLPSLATAVAANQLPGLSHLHQRGATYLLDSGQNFQQELIMNFEKISDLSIRQQMQDNCAQLQIAEHTSQLITTLVNDG
jgi:UDP-2,4-diacetamido-2,4,6-trideoxy-beta-L-altropyranose hydrolase